MTIAQPQGTIAMAQAAGLPVSVVNDLLAVVNASVIYICVCCGICVWEWLINLRAEYNGIWKAQWSFVKCTYLVSRYGIFIGMAVSIWLWTNSFTAAECSKLFHLIPGFFILTELSGEIILMMRVYALSGRSLYVLFPLSAILLGYLGLDLYIAIDGMTMVPIFQEKDYCIPNGGVRGNVILGYWIVPMVFDAIVTALMIWYMRPHFKNGSASTIMRVFLREGLLYFVVITLANALNIAFFAQTTFSGQAINTGFSLAMTSIMSCRLILSLRDKEALAPRSQAHGSASFWAGRSALDAPLKVPGSQIVSTPHAVGHALPLSKLESGEQYSEKSLSGKSAFHVHGDAYVLGDDLEVQQDVHSTGVRVERTVAVSRD